MPFSLAFLEHLFDYWMGLAAPIPDLTVPVRWGLMEPIVVGTDGSSRGNPGPAGWAWVVNKNAWQCGSLPRATSMVAEMTAVYRALVELPADRDVIVLTDSETTMKTVERWIRGWSENNWRKADGKPVRNLDLVQAIWALMNARTGSLRAEWVRSHGDHPLNITADKLATTAARAGKGRALVNGPSWPG